jgi:hypothetical protein
VRSAGELCVVLSLRDGPSALPGIERDVLEAPPILVQLSTMSLRS